MSRRRRERFSDHVKATIIAYLPGETPDQSRIEFDVDGERRTSLLPPSWNDDLADAFAYQRRMLIPGDGILVRHPYRDVDFRSDRPLRSIAVGRVEVSLTTVRVMQEEEVSAAEFASFGCMLSYVPPTLGNMGIRCSKVRQKGNRLVPECPLGGGHYLIGDQVLLDRRTSHIPETMINSLRGMALRDLISHRLTDGIDITIRSVTEDAHDLFLALDMPTIGPAETMRMLGNGEAPGEGMTT